MKTTTWAENEVNIACEREKANSKDDEWIYGCNCYESALKAYKSLESDNHSGFSYSLTVNILKRLLDRLPLTPIEDTPDIWLEDDQFPIEENSGVWLQCKRRPSLFKLVDGNGNVTYRDLDRYVCYDINHPDVSYHNSFISEVAKEICPITFPYKPNGVIRIYCEDFISEIKDGGDYDTIGIFYLIDESGEKKKVHRFFKWNNGHWKEINSKEYNERKAKK